MSTVVCRSSSLLGRLQRCSFDCGDSVCRSFSRSANQFSPQRFHSPPARVAASRLSRWDQGNGFSRAVRKEIYGSTPSTSQSLIRSASHFPSIPSPLCARPHKPLTASGLRHRRSILSSPSCTRGFHTTSCMLDVDGSKSKVEQQLELLREEIARDAEQRKQLEASSKSKLTETSVESQGRIRYYLGKAREGVVHTIYGFRLFMMDIGISLRLILSVMRGSTLSRRERRQLIRTAADIFRMVPFMVFIIVPFMELLLPVYLYFFPGMMPTSFHHEEPKQEVAKFKQQLKLRLEMAKFLQATLEQMSLERKKAKTDDSSMAVEFTNFMKKVRRSGNYATNEELLKFSKLFEDELTLDNLDLPQLKALCKIVNIQPIGTEAYLRFRLQYRLRGIKADDQLISRDGVDALSIDELQAANRARGMRAYGLPVHRLRSQLQQWLELSLNDKIPPSLLLLSRTLYLPEDISTADRLNMIIASLPESVGAEAALKLSELEGKKVDNKQRLELVQQIEAALKREKAEHSKRLEDEKKKAEVAAAAAAVSEQIDAAVLEQQKQAAAEAARKVDQIKLAVQPDIPFDLSSVDRGEGEKQAVRIAARLLARDKGLTTSEIMRQLIKNKVLDPAILEKVEKEEPEKKGAGNTEVLPEWPPVSPRKIKYGESPSPGIVFSEGASASKVELDSLAEIGKVIADVRGIKEAQKGVEELKEDFKEYKEDVAAIQSLAVLKGDPASESKAAKRLAKRVDGILGRLEGLFQSIQEEQCKHDLPGTTRVGKIGADKEMHEVKLKMESPLSAVKASEQTDPDKSDTISINDLLLAMRRVQKFPDGSKEQKIVQVLDALDDNKDGYITAEHALKVIELIANENLMLNSRQVSKIVELLRKEDQLEQALEVQEQKKAGVNITFVDIPPHGDLLEDKAKAILGTGDKTMTSCNDIAKDLSETRPEDASTAPGQATDSKSGLKNEKSGSQGPPRSTQSAAGLQNELPKTESSTRESTQGVGHSSDSIASKKIMNDDLVSRIEPLVTPNGNGTPPPSPGAQKPLHMSGNKNGKGPIQS